jgi:heat shock protein HslJ
VRHNNVEGWVAARYLREYTGPLPPQGASAAAAQPGRPVAARSDAPFTGVEWRAAMIGNIELRESLAWLRFKDTGELEGHTGCNVLRGSFTSGETALRIALVMVTRMACLGETMAAQERLLIAALESAEAQQVMGGVLRLYGQGGVVHAVFRSQGR